MILVCVDWGSALAFDWANRHRGSVQGVVYMEAIVRPRTWDDYTARRPAGGGREAIQRLRSHEGERLVLEENLFVEQVLPSMVMRTMSDDEMAEYRRPYLVPGEGRRAMRAWPQELPIDGKPADNVTAVQAYADWLSNTDVPKLFINGDPGMSLVDGQREFCRSWPNQREITVSGYHNLPEDSPDAIGLPWPSSSRIFGIATPDIRRGAWPGAFSIDLESSRIPAAIYESSIRLVAVALGIRTE